MCACVREFVCVYLSQQKSHCQSNTTAPSSILRMDRFHSLNPLLHAQIHYPSFYAAAKGFITCMPKKIRICNCCKYIRLANARFAFVFSLLLPRDCTMGLRWKNQTDRLPRLLLLFKQPCPLKANFNLIARVFC